LIELELTPQISYIGERKMDLVSLEELTVTVGVRDKQPAVIGGFISEPEFGRNFFTLSSGQEIEVVITPAVRE